MKLWQVVPSLESYEITTALQEENPPQFDIDPLRTIDRVLSEATIRLQHGEGGPVPVPQDLKVVLSTTSSAVTFNYFDVGVRIISGRLRDVLRLGGGQVQYVDVDSTSCPKAVRDMDYKLLHLTYSGEPFDRERSDGEWIDMPESPIGPRVRTGRYWRLRPPQPDLARRIRWREDFVPPSPLFQAVGPPWTLATDELVQRVRAAGIGDVSFVDVTIDVEPGPYTLSYDPFD